MNKWVYNFSGNKAEGNAKDRNLLGGKGSNLAEMCLIGLPVPPGFTITTEACNYYYDHNKTLPTELTNQVNESIAKIENELGRKFGDPKNPLLVSVRSGARASMPGMMDTVLNLGLNDETVQGLIEVSGNERFAYDSYRRFIQMYSDVVLGIEMHNFEELLELKKSEKGVVFDTDLDVDDLKALVREYKERVELELGSGFPQDAWEQLWGGVKAVFNSWQNHRAITYRRIHDIPASWGTAVNIQSMVFGNLGSTSATGVAFTRNPSTGDKRFYGEYLVNAQGEDVVAGIRTPAEITIAGRKENNNPTASMEEVMPEVYNQLVAIYQKLEKHYRDMQDIEFTVEKGKLFILQTRSGKRTAKAAIKIAVDMVEEGMISKEEAVMRVAPESLDQLMHKTLDPKAKFQVVDKGLPASPGAASGKIVLSAEEAEKMAGKNEKVILVRIETSPEDIGGMHVSAGILTARGGMTSHAAVVARGMGKTCVCGASGIHIDYTQKTVSAMGVTMHEGDVITINGSTGEVILGEVPTIEPEISPEFSLLMSWADGFRRLKVRANAETELDAKTAVRFGAEGIGLCRTEHMFFEADRIIAVREMIVSDNLYARVNALNKILPMQRGDFKKILMTMEDRPVTIRLLDPPLHEFLPHHDDEIAEVAEAAGVTASEVKRRIAQLQESNPMLGHRGCRLGITFPEIYEMQARAIFEAAVEVHKETGKKPVIEVMIPLVMRGRELDILGDVVRKTADEVLASSNLQLDYLVGTMIELPRAALVADEIAKYADFFSFGTNDLTQTTLGISRDDAGAFLEDYKSQGIIEYDPFVVLDREGVGQLIEMAKERGRATKPKLKVGVCGEHGGNPSSIEFFEMMGLDYISCSPYRIPVARLAAAQSYLKLAELSAKKVAVAG